MINMHFPLSRAGFFFTGVCKRIGKRDTKDSRAQGSVLHAGSDLAPLLSTMAPVEGTFENLLRTIIDP
jgi:hypothetical protein